MTCDIDVGPYYDTSKQEDFMALMREIVRVPIAPPDRFGRDKAVDPTTDTVAGSG